MFNAPTKSRGYLLLELIAAVLVIGIAASAILIPISDANVSSARVLSRQMALSVAQGMLDEAMGRTFAADPAANGSILISSAAAIGRRRTDLMHDLADYHNYSTVSTGTRAIDNSGVAGLSSFRVTVFASSLSSFPGIAATDARLPRSVITGSGISQIELSAVKINTGNVMMPKSYLYACSSYTSGPTPAWCASVPDPL